MRRGGTKFVRSVKDATDRCGWIRFQFNVEQAYVLEVGDLYVRFYTDHGVVLNGTNPLELTTPWPAADLFDADGNFLLRSYVQSGDTLYICHAEGLYEPQKLVRAGALSWSINDLAQDGGPFEDIDPDETVTVYSSGNTGTVTLTASSAATFTSDHIGALILVEQNDDDTTEAWEPGKGVSANQVRRVENRNYQAVNTGTTGTITPSHTRGSVYDGDNGVQWTFLDPSYGWARITAVSSSGSSCTATVLSRIPNGAVGSAEATLRWAFGEWSEVNGWPTHATFFRERLTFARATTRQLWFSKSGDFENFNARDDAGDIVADGAISIEVTSDEVNRIEWISPADALLVGTAGAEFAVSEITNTEPFGPGNVKAVPNSGYGSRAVQAIRVGDSVLYVQRSGRKLRDLSYRIEREKFISTNMSVLARHLLPKGKAIIAMAYQQEPHSVVWVLRNDGLLIATTLNVNQRRFGWHRHPIGGSFGTGDAVVEAIEVIPNPTADADELWLIVKRTVNGSTVRYIEYMEQEWDSADDILEAFYLDSGLTYDGTVAQTLTPGTGATVVDTTGVTFTAGGSAFVSGNIGKEIRYRYQDADDVWHTARAEITAVNSATVAVATIVSVFPSLSAIAASGWGITATVISGLDHLEGETLDVLADGAPHAQVTVASGSVTLDSPSFYAHFGLPCSCKIALMRLEAGAADGTAQGKTKRSHQMTIRVVDTVGGEAGPDDDNLDEILFRDANDYQDEPLPAFNGDKEIAWPDGYNKDAFITYVNDQPLPATIVAFMPQVMTQD